MAHSTRVLWCCFPVLHSFRSFLVPKPRLHTTGSGNSFVFPSPEYWRRKVLHLFPQGRGLSRLPQFFFAPHTGILGSYPSPRQFQSPSFSAPSQGLWMRVVFLPHLFFLSGGWIIQGVCGRKGRAVVRVLLCWEMRTATVPGLWWKDNYRPDWWLLDALTRCQGFMCPALPPSQFLQDQKTTAYRCLKTFPKILESVGCDVQKPSALHLKKVMPPSWLQGLENLANSFPNGEHNWLTLVKFHTKSRHSCSPLRRCLGSSCSQWLIRSVGLGAEYIGTRVLVKFSFELSVWGLQRQFEHPECLTQLTWAWVHVSSAKPRQVPSQICPISPTLCWSQMYFRSTSSQVRYTFAAWKGCCDRSSYA